MYICVLYCTVGSGASCEKRVKINGWISFRRKGLGEDFKARAESGIRVFKQVSEGKDYLTNS
jgi:hypothetical protein